jgi:hypothetical protein
LSSVSVGVALLLDEGQQQRLDRRAGRFARVCTAARRAAASGLVRRAWAWSWARIGLISPSVSACTALSRMGSSARRRPCRRAALGCGEALGAIGREQAQRRQGAIDLLRRRC